MGGVVGVMSSRRNGSGESSVVMSLLPVSKSFVPSLFLGTESSITEGVLTIMKSFA